MSRVNHTLGERIQHDDARICYELRSRGVKLTVDQYKILRFAFRAAGITIAALAMFDPGVRADPAIVLPVLAAFVLGPDVVEAYLTRES